MKIQVNTDRHIEGGDSLTEEVEQVVGHQLKHVGDVVTRVEVHLRDINSDERGGNSDKRCTLEARIEGRSPTVVTEDHATVAQAVRSGAEKLRRALESELGKLRDRR